MNSLVRSTLFAGLLAGSALVARAEDPAAPASAPAPSTAPAAATAHKKTHAAPAPEAKKLTPEERKARTEARIKDLRAKKAAGKISEKESQQLERLEKRTGAPAKHAPKAPAKAHKTAPAPAPAADPAPAPAKTDSQGATK
jgi:hypothetical protein